MSQIKLYKKTKAPTLVRASGMSGAATQIRTGDLILTKDVLYQLSHSSKYLQGYCPSDLYIIANVFRFVKMFLKYFYVDFNTRVGYNKIVT